jgi:hypothetical protein
MPTAQNPLGPPTLSGSTVTVDLWLKQPTRITQFISDVTLQRFLSEKVLSSDGGVSGGAVIYDQLTANDLYPSRNPEPIAPGGEYPVLQDTRPTPKVANVVKWGAKLYITDEARDRNDQSLWLNSLRRMGNSMVKTIDAYAVAIMEAAFTAFSSQVAAGHSWSAVTPIGATPTAIRSWPGADIQAAVTQAQVDELGYEYDTILLNPLDSAQLSYVYGATEVDALLRDSYGVARYVSNRVPAGTAYVLASQQPGGFRVEAPLSSVTYRDENTDRTWVKSGVRLVAYIDQPYAMRKITGIA